MTQVVAAVIERDGKILICQRSADQPHPGKWEFPGGKIEAGESPEVALRRELMEELGIRATIGREIVRYQFAYPGKQPILLMFFSVTQFEGEPENRIFEQILWEDRRTLPAYDFLEGDVEFVSGLAG